MINQWEGYGNMTKLNCKPAFMSCTFTGNDILKENNWRPVDILKFLK